MIRKRTCVKNINQVDGTVDIFISASNEPVRYIGNKILFKKFLKLNIYEVEIRMDETALLNNEYLSIIFKMY